MFCSALSRHTATQTSRFPAPVATITVSSHSMFQRIRCGSSPSSRDSSSEVLDHSSGPAFRRISSEMPGKWDSSIYCAQTETKTKSVGRQEFSFGRSLVSPGSPVGSTGKTPVGGLGDFSQKLKQFADIVYTFWLQKRSKCENLHNSSPDSWPICFTVRAKRHFGGFSPQPIVDAVTGQHFHPSFGTSISPPTFFKIFHFYHPFSALLLQAKMQFFNKSFPP